MSSNTMVPVEPFALEHVTLVTGDEHGSTHEDTTVLVDANGLIAYVGPTTGAASIPRSYRLVNGTGKYVMPGLINAHAHMFGNGKPLSAFLLQERTETLVTGFLHSPLGRLTARRLARESAREHLLSGVTTMRTVGDLGYEGVEVARQIASGDRLGPRMLVSGPILAVTGGHGSPKITLTSDSPWQGRRNVRYSLRKGVDCIKIAATGGMTDARRVGEAGRPQMTEAEMQAICEEAHQAGLIVAAHAQSREGVSRALRAGVDTIEHGAPLDDEMIALFHHNPRSLRGWSALIPTVSPAMPTVILDRSITRIGDVAYANAKIVTKRMLDGLSQALDNDIVVGVGNDCACTFVTQYSLWRELEMMHRYAGMSTAAVLHAATEVDAKILNLSTVTGSIAPGKSADMVLLDANPLENLRALATPAAVVARGHIIEQPQVRHIASIDEALDGMGAYDAEPNAA